MKNIAKYMSLVGVGVLCLTSCDNDEFLNTTQYDIISTDAEYESDDNALTGLNGIYAYNNSSDQCGNWGIKPNIFTGTHPTMDTQCTGWDVKFLDQTWDASVSELYEGWSHAYKAICRANMFLSGLETATALSDDVKKTCEGEARCLRGYFYTWLAQTFGRVPMLATGEDYSNTPVKAKADTYEEMWDFIIEDFKAAADLLSWTPYNDQYGRCTKGMALSYLGDAYMWKAYRCPDKATECYGLAKTALKTVLDQGPYKLQTNFSTNWDPAGAWNDECIWAMVIDEGDNWSGWSNLIRSSNTMMKWMVAPINCGGWGTEYLSWEWYASYEHGDKRRDYSCATGAIPEDQLAKYGIEKGETYNYNPYLEQYIGTPGDDTDQTTHFHYGSTEFAPSIWSTKLWRSSYADNDHNCWGYGIWEPVNIYWKRLPNVMLDYAECCFRTGDEAAGWAQINTLRNRAWGNLEVGQDYSGYLNHYNQLHAYFGEPTFTSYPQKTNTEVVAVPDAKTHYTEYAKKNFHGKAFSSEVWKVAVNEERRKEFSSEWGLLSDMVKSGYIEDHIANNYPTDATSGEALMKYPWSHRTFTYDATKMDMPIPQLEITRNSALVQNDGYGN